MELNFIDYTLITFFFLAVLVIGLLVSKKAGKDTSEFFLSGRSMPWWLLGLSMVATTFSTDTPNFVTNVVRVNGVSGNWEWWAFLITGLLTVFVYAKLWRKSNVNTDIEFYEIRYGGKPGRFLRGFRSIYLGVVFNVLAMAGVTLAAIKIGGVMLNLQPWQTVLSASLVTVIFSAIGGFRGVVYTDFLLFFVAMGGAIGAAYYCVTLPEVGGIDNLVNHTNVIDKINILPDFSDKEALITLLIIPLAIQWWSSWFPGAEPGGGGYIAQRMLAAKNENHAISATFFFNIMHYALRPWPWILVALSSLIVFPNIESLHEAFPHIPTDKLGDDLAYSAMLTKLPNGLLGLVLASLIAAYMSTISTHLNWGASYVVNDFYKQQVNSKASEKTLVGVGRIATVVLMVLSSILALYLNNALQLFKFILMFGAGTGLIFILRWFWWRINAWSEISAMVASGVISLIFSSAWGSALFYNTLEPNNSALFPSYLKFPIIVGLSTIVWLVVTYVTKPEKEETLFSFYKKIQPGGPGWKTILNQAEQKNITLIEDNAPWSVPNGILAIITSLILIYSTMFATGYWIYGDYNYAIGLTITALISGAILVRIWTKIKANLL